MKSELVDFAKDRVVYNFTDCTREEIENKLNLFFTSEGYKNAGQKDSGIVYTKGNRTMRILFGAFVKYFRMFVSVKSENNLYSVLLLRDSSGISGGLIGMRQVKKEFERLSEAFRAYFKD